ncbi:MAG: hypothetical protein J7K61_03050, partial [Thermoplasmata archaeon]|nr:hypothetical protein [Thermoplasmata archaeon]
VIGWYGLTNTTASWLIDNITDASMVVDWNASSQRFGDGYFHGPVDDFLINLGDGVFVFIDSSSPVQWRH